MRDHNQFANRNGDIFANGNITPMIQTVRADSLATDRAIIAYRNNIAPPEIAIADRTVEYVPTVVGEDGKEITPERRAQLMQESGAEPMFNAEGKPNEGVNYLGVFDRVIETERLGKSAEDARPGYRVVRPREVELENLDYDDRTVASASGATHVPAVGGQTELPVGLPAGSSDALAVFYLGTAPEDHRILQSIRDATQLIADETGHGAAYLRINEAHLERIQPLLRDTFSGLGSLQQCVTDSPGLRILADPAYSRAYVHILLEDLPKGADDAE